MADPYLVYLLEYNAWATAVVLDCLDASPELLDANAPGAFGTIAETMNHLLGAEGAYLNRLANGPAFQDPPPMSLEQMRVYAQELAARGRERLASLPEADAIVQRSHGAFHAKAVFGQLIQHGIEHRAQICMVIGAHGLEAPDLTSWRFGGKQ